MNLIGIRTTGGKNKGMGHIVRCSTIAKELEKRYFKVLFIIDNDPSIIRFLEDKHFSYRVLKSNNLCDEVNEMEYLFIKHNIDTLITDSYWLSDDYLLSIRKLCKYLISIDDLNLYNYPSDIVINYNLYADELNYNKNNNIKYLLGGNFSLLRDEFQDNRTIDIKKNCKNILVTMGGTDINNYTLNILKSIYNIKDININVVVNSSFKNLTNIYTFTQNKDNISLIYNPENMKDVMLQNDIAISSGGTTVYELVSLLIPSILIIQATNQILLCEKIDSINAGINAGCFNDLSLERLKLITIEFLNNYEKRKILSHNCKNIISHNGVKNIVNEIINLIYSY